MKEHFQDFGVRKWAGDDLIELQAEPLAALQGLVAPYAPCILQGCEMTPETGGAGVTRYKVSAGLAALKGEDASGNACVKIVRVAEETKLAETVYLYLACESKSRTYADGKNKVITYEYKGKFSNQPVEGALKISKDDGGPRLVDTLGITRKLDIVDGNAKDVVVGFTEADTRSELTTGSKLGVLFGLVKKWCSDLRALAFKDKVAESDLETALSGKVNAKLDTVGGEAKDVVVGFTEAITRSELTTGSKLGVLFGLVKKWCSDLRALAFKDKVAESDLETALSGKVNAKLDTVGGEAKDVVVTFVEDAGKDAPEDLPSGLTLGVLINRIKKWLGKKVDKRDGYVLSKNDFSDEWMKKLDGINDNANNYVHPTYPSTSSGLYKIAVDGSGHVSGATAVTKSDITTLGIPGQDTTYSVATTYSDGLMSSTDKSKLNGIAYNANNYSLPLASSSVRGGVKIGYTQSGKNYPVQLSSEKMYVNVPWTDTVYTHPTSSGYKHIPSGGSSGQYLKYSSSGTAQWVSPANNIATTSTSGFMSAADKKKLTDMGCTTGSFSGGTIYPGKVYLLSSNASVSVTKQTSFDSGSCVSYIAANNGSLRITNVSKGTGIGMIYMSQNAKTVITGSSARVGIYKFIWSGGDVVYVDFICDQWYA